MQDRPHREDQTKRASFGRKHQNKNFQQWQAQLQGGTRCRDSTKTSSATGVKLSYRREAHSTVGMRASAFHVRCIECGADGTAIPTPFVKAGTDRPRDMRTSTREVADGVSQRGHRRTRRTRARFASYHCSAREDSMSKASQALKDLSPTASLPQHCHSPATALPQPLLYICCFTLQMGSAHNALAS